MYTPDQYPYINQASNVVDAQSLYIFLKIAMAYHPIITGGLMIFALGVGVYAYYIAQQYVTKRIFELRT